MATEFLDFAELMLEANRVTVALDAVTRRDGPRVAAAPVSYGKRVHAQLLEYQRTARLSGMEAHALQTMLDLLHARLKFFGETV